MVTSFGEFDADDFADRFERETIARLIDTGLERKTFRGGAADALQIRSGEDSSDHSRALVRAVDQVLSPRDLADDSLSSTLIGMVSLRANTTEFLDRYPNDVGVRYVRAAEWVCEHFRSIIFTCK